MVVEGLCQRAWRAGEDFIEPAQLQCVLQIAEAYISPNCGLWYTLEWE